MPLQIWLKNAIELAGLRMEAGVFRIALAHARAAHQGWTGAVSAELKKLVVSGELQGKTTALLDNLNAAVLQGKTLVTDMQGFVNDPEMKASLKGTMENFKVMSESGTKIAANAELMAANGVEISAETKTLMAKANKLAEQVQELVEKFNKTIVDGLLSEVTAVKLAGVRPYDKAWLSQRGFYITQQGLFGNEGSLAITTKDGLRYWLFFGEVALDERLGSLTEVTVLVPLNPEDL